MSNDRTIEYYMRQIHELVAKYNAVSENVESDETAEASAVELLVEARDVVREALTAGFRNEELIELHVDLVISLSWHFLRNALAAEEYTQSFMEPEEFVQRWGELEHLRRADKAQMLQYEVGEEATQFLVEAGLPGSAAPMVNFLGEGQIGRLWEVWGLDEEETAYAKEDFSTYLIIGNDSNGNPFCIDQENSDIVVLLDHDYGFQAVTFVNSSVQQLAECLLVYRALWEQVRQYEDEGDTLPDDILAWAEKEFLRVDSRAMSRECFWRNELEVLRQP